MRELAKDAAAIDVTDLLTRYSFDLGGYALDRVVESWLNQYPVQWVRLAVIEALYQGRYKAFSVEQILNLWQRRGRSLYRFTHEFERIVCGRFPNNQFIHHEAIHPPVPRSRSTQKSQPSIIPPPGISPIQPIKTVTEPARFSPSEETVTPTNGTGEQGIATWSPREDKAELLRENEVEAATLIQPEPSDVDRVDLASPDLASPDLSTEFAEREFAGREFADREFAGREHADTDLVDAEFPALEPEPFDNLIDEQLADEYLANEHLADKHLADEYLANEQLADDPEQTNVDQPEQEADVDLHDTDLDSTRPIHRGGPVPTFRPATSADLELFSNGNWSNSTAHQQPIHQFIPTPEPSDFYSKLRAVALQSAPSHQVDISHLAPTEREHY